MKNIFYINKSHVICADSLKINWENMPKFDVVVGNPPFQAARNFKGSTILWPSFFKLSDKILKKNGWLAFISPYTWMGAIDTKSKHSKVSLENFNTSELKYLDLMAGDHFNVGSSTICFVIFQKNHKESKNVKTKYKNFETELDISSLPFMPQHINSNEDFEIFNKVLNNKLPKIKLYNETFGKGVRKNKNNAEKTLTLKYPNYYTWSSFKKNQFLWTSTPGLYSSEPKIIVFYTNGSTFTYDDGHIGLAHLTAGIPCKNEKEYKNIMSILDSKLYKFVSKFVPFKGTHGDKEGTVKYFPKLDFSHSWTNKQLYDYFNLTQEEIDYIESQVK